MKIIYVVMLVFFFSGCSNLDSLVSDINKTITTNKKSEPTQVKKSVPKTPWEPCCSILPIGNINTGLSEIFSFNSSQDKFSNFINYSPKYFFTRLSNSPDFFIFSIS